MAKQIQLIVVDANNTLGVRTGTATKQVLCTLSPLPEDSVAQEIRRVLHRAPPLTEDVITEVCNALLIPPDSWPRPWPDDSGFDLYDHTPGTLATLAEIAPVAVLTNRSVTAGARRMTELRDQCAPYLSRIYTSYEMGMRKPDPRLWQRIADDHHVTPETVVHIGDRWVNDVRGAVFAGCRAIYVNSRRRPVPPADQWPAGPGRIGIADNLREVPPILTAWLSGQPAPAASATSAPESESA